MGLNSPCLSSYYLMTHSMRVKGNYNGRERRINYG